MVFESKSQQVPEPSVMGDKQKLRIDLEARRTKQLELIKAVYTNEVKKISRTKLIKLAIDNFIVDLESYEDEDVAIEHIRSLYKEAEF